MSRRRSKDPSVPISIAIPRSLHTRLNELLAYKQSRSKWVCGAIRAKLEALDNGYRDIDDINNHRLLAILCNRGAISYKLFETLKEEMPVVGTVKEQ